jgi:CHAT domain
MHVRSAQSGLPVAKFDTDRLQQMALDDHEYSKLITESLFADETVRSFFSQVRATSETLSCPVRFRLLVGLSAPELHSLRWEMVRDPNEGSLLSAGERTFFSRYLSRIDWRPVRRRRKEALRALVAIANPSDVAAYRPGGRELAPVDVAGELARALNGLAGIASTELASGGRATENCLLMHLREDDGYHVPYLVAHGAVEAGNHFGAEAWFPFFVADVKEVRFPPGVHVGQNR